MESHHHEHTHRITSLNKAFIIGIVLNLSFVIVEFGVGFYSAFMVADEVHIDTLSYKEGATPVHWECDGGSEYDMQDGG